MRRFVYGFVFLILVGVAVAQVNVGGPTPGQDPNYPLRVRILTRNTSRSQYGMRTWGRADLFGGAHTEQGFDYESTCDEVVMVTHGDERYSARWKKPDRELEILVSKIGSGKANKCSVKIDLQQFFYDFEKGSSGPVVTKPLPN